MNSEIIIIIFLFFLLLLKRIKPIKFIYSQVYSDFQLEPNSDKRVSITRYRFRSSNGKFE